MASHLVLRARDAVNVLARRLSELPPSADIAELRGRVAEYTREVESWPSLHPSSQQSNALSVGLLHLFAEMTKIEAGGGAGRG